MKYISIGGTCCVKYQIDKFRQKEETLFFDYLMTSINSVIEILGSTEITNILHFDNIIPDPNSPYENENSRIIIKSLDHCVSIHDLKKKFTSNDILDFIEKYTRRFNRIIDYIKSSETIIFIRYGAVDSTTIQLFIKTILKINASCNFLLCVVDNNNTNDIGIFQSDKYLYFKLNVDIPVSMDWTKSYLNWEKIFCDIEKILS